MKIIFISDFNLNQCSGGAEVSNDLIIREGLSRGHDIISYNHDTSPINLLQNYDLVVSSNLSLISSKDSGVIEFILSSNNHVRLEHDSCLYLTTESRAKLFSSSRINFFLSKFHLDFFKSMYGDIFKDTMIIPDPIDTDIFKKTESSRKKYDIVYCGFLSELKGFGKLLEYARNNPERKIDIFGWGLESHQALSLSKEFKNITFNTKVNHESMPKIFNQCRSVFHNPILNEPFCRMVGEAILCGVEDIIGNPSKIGSFLEFKRLGLDKFKNRCCNASVDFWKNIESLDLC